MPDKIKNRTGVLGLINYYKFGPTLQLTIHIYNECDAKALKKNCLLMLDDPDIAKLAPYLWKHTANRSRLIDMFLTENHAIRVKSDINFILKNYSQVEKYLSTNSLNELLPTCLDYLNSNHLLAHHKYNPEKIAASCQIIQRAGKAEAAHIEMVGIKKYFEQTQDLFERSRRFHVLATHHYAELNKYLIKHADEIKPFLLTNSKNELLVFSLKKHPALLKTLCTSAEDYAKLLKMTDNPIDLTRKILRVINDDQREKFLDKAEKHFNKHDHKHLKAFQEIKNQRSVKNQLTQSLFHNKPRLSTLIASVRRHVY